VLFGKHLWGKQLPHEVTYIYLDQTSYLVTGK